MGALLAGFLEAIYFYTLARALDVGRLGAVYTVSRGGALVVVWPLSILLFAEVATVPAIVGSGVVLGGLVLSSLAPSSQRSAGHNAGIAWAALCAASIAGYHLSYKAALLGGGSGSAVFAVSLSFAGAINIVRIGGEGRRKLRALISMRGRRIALMGLLCGGSFLILMEALARGGSGYVLTLRNTSVLFAAGLAWTIGERPRHAELVGAALVAVGAVLMAL